MVSGLTELSAPMHKTACVSPRRIASTPSWIAVAPEAQAEDTVSGMPLVPNRSAMRSAIEPNCAADTRHGSVRLQPPPAGHRTRVLGLRHRLVPGLPGGTTQFPQAEDQYELTGKASSRLETRLVDRLCRRDFGEPLGQCCVGTGVTGNGIDGSGNCGAEPGGIEALDVTTPELPFSNRDQSLTPCQRRVR